MTFGKPLSRRAKSIRMSALVLVVLVSFAVVSRATLSRQPLGFIQQTRLVHVADAPLEQAEISEQKAGEDANYWLS